MIPGNQLALSSAGIRQVAANNLSLHHDAINDVTATIVLNNVSGNVGINSHRASAMSSSTGVTTALSF